MFKNLYRIERRLLTLLMMRSHKIDLSSVGNNNNTSRTSMRVGSENFGKDEVITNAHISRQGSLDITTQELPSIADDIDLTNESLNLKQDEEQEATSAVTSALRPQNVQPLSVV